MFKKNIFLCIICCFAVVSFYSVIIFYQTQNNNNFYSVKNYKYVGNNFVPLSILQVDKQLQQMSKNYNFEFVNPIIKNKYNFSKVKHAMKTVKEMFDATTMIIKPKIFCEGNYGLNLSLVVLIYVAVNNFQKREIIRNTYGFAIKNNPNVKMYFLVGVNNDSK